MREGTVTRAENSEADVVRGPLTPEQRIAVRKLWWTPAVRPAQILALVGFAILLVSWIYLAFVLVTVPLHSGVTSLDVDALILLFAGGGVWIAGITWRNHATGKIAYRPCPACRTKNVFTSEHCSKCGAPLPPITFT